VATRGLLYPLYSAQDSAGEMAEDQRQNVSAICKPKSTAFSVGKLSAERMDERLVE